MSDGRILRHPAGAGQDWTVAGGAPVLVLGVPTRGKGLFKRVASGKKLLQAIYSEALRECYPDSIELVGVISGRWNSTFYQLSVPGTIKHNIPFGKKKS